MKNNFIGNIWRKNFKQQGHNVTDLEIGMEWGERRQDKSSSNVAEINECVYNEEVLPL